MHRFSANNPGDRTLLLVPTNIFKLKRAFAEKEKDKLPKQFRLKAKDFDLVH